MLQGTWFRLDHASALTLTHQGTRPGDGLADVLFAFSFAAYLRCADAAVTHNGLATRVPQTRTTEPWDTGTVPENLSCGAWADDFVHMHLQPCPVGLCDAVLRIVTCYVEQADSIGMTLGFAKDKTAAIMPVSSLRDDPVAVIHTGPEGQYLIGHSVLSGGSFELPLVQAYKHLGGITTVTGTPAPEISFRAAQAWNVIRPFRQRLFSAVGIALRTRRLLLRSLAMTRFVFGSAVLPLHCALHFRTWAQHYTALWRSLLRRKPDERTPHAYTTLHAADAPSPPLALALGRASLLRQIVVQGPATLKRLLWAQWELEGDKSWLGAVLGDVRHAAQYISAAKVLLHQASPPPSSRRFVTGPHGGPCS